MRRRPTPLRRWRNHRHRALPRPRVQRLPPARLLRRRLADPAGNRRQALLLLAHHLHRRPEQRRRHRRGKTQRGGNPPAPGRRGRGPHRKRPLHPRRDAGAPETPARDRQPAHAHRHPPRLRTPQNRRGVHRQRPGHPSQRGGGGAERGFHPVGKQRPHARPRRN